VLIQIGGLVMVLSGQRRSDSWTAGRRGISLPDFATSWGYSSISKLESRVGAVWRLAAGGHGTLGQATDR